MTRRNLARTLGGALVACAMDFGFLTKMVGSKWKFTTIITKIDFPNLFGLENGGWVATIMQHPSWMDPDKYHGPAGLEKCFQRQITIPNEKRIEDMQQLVDRVILERKYELGEPDGVQGAASTPFVS